MTTTKIFKYIRTCSRVSSGPCSYCKDQTYFCAYRWRTETLCKDCYEKTYEPKAYAKRMAGIKKARADRERDLALALKGKLPGAKITANGTASGTVFGPPKTYLGGLVGRQVLREGLYDTEGFGDGHKRKSN